MSDVARVRHSYVGLGLDDVGAAEVVFSTAEGHTVDPLAIHLHERCVVESTSTLFLLIIFLFLPLAGILDAGREIHHIPLGKDSRHSSHPVSPTGIKRLSYGNILITGFFDKAMNRK